MHRLQHSNRVSLWDFALFFVLINTVLLAVPVQADSVTLNADLFDPYFLEREGKYVYVTSFGKYSFSKEDGAYEYAYLDGIKLCPSVKFDIQHLTGDSWEDFQQDYFSLRGLSNEHFAFSVNVLNGSQLMGVLDVDCDFFRAKPPKLTVHFRELEDCKPYRLVFKVTLPQAWRYFWHDRVVEMTQTEYKLRAREVRLYNQSQMQSPLNILIDWAQFGVTDCILKGSTVRVIFPTNVEGVDPSTVAEVSVIWATKFSSQRKLLFAEGLWFVAYRYGTPVAGQFVFKTSSDGISWSDPTALGQWKDKEFTWFYNGTYLHYVSSDFTQEKLYYRAGQPLSNGSVQWLDDLQEILDVGSGNDVEYISLAVDSSGYPFIIYYLDNPESVKVLKSNWNNGTWSTDFNTQLSTVNESHQPQIVPLTNNQMFALYQPHSPREIKGKLWNSSAWQSEENCTDSDFWLSMSAVAVDDDVHLVFVSYAGYDVTYIKRDSVSGWSTETTLFDGALTANRPCISKAGSNLIVFWDSEKKIYSKKLIAGEWQDTKELADESSADTIYTGSLTTAYEAGASHLAVLYTIGDTKLVRFAEEGGLLVTLSASPTELSIGDQTTLSWTVTYLNGSEVSSYSINITRDGTLILQDSSDSSLTDKFGSAGLHTYTCSGVTDASMTAFESNSVNVEWTGEEGKGEGTEDGFGGGGSFSEQVQQITKTLTAELRERGLYWMAGLLGIVSVAGMYAGLKTKKVSRSATGTTGAGGSRKLRGTAGSERRQPKGTPRKRRRDARGRFL